MPKRKGLSISLNHWYLFSFHLRVSNRLTNGSRGTANAWHFHYALVFVVTVLCGSLVMALAAP
ncbi:TPA: DUF3265 domain-containing protein [Vibrio vulnificus]|nr:DUF3265 domain-containing protein [Vibrio vulnificus]